jgi:hypothetical protein
MRNIKLTETEWKYICDALVHANDFVDSWEADKFTREWYRKIAILKRAEHKVFTAKRMG